MPSMAPPEEAKVVMPDKAGYRVIPQAGCVQFLVQNKFDIRPTVVTIPLPILAAAYATMMLTELQAQQVDVTLPEGLVKGVAHSDTKRGHTA